jgi:hypothetical protein
VARVCSQHRQQRSTQYESNSVGFEEKFFVFHGMSVTGETRRRHGVKP